MNSDRIKEIQSETGYPDSVSVYQALMKVWNECSQGEPDNTEKGKCGMYGEMPIVRIGRISISQMSDAEGEDNVWIEYGDGEGMEINGGILESDLEKIFDKHF